MAAGLPWGLKVACCKVLSGAEGLSAAPHILGMCFFLENGMLEFLMAAVKKLNARKVHNSGW